MEMIRVHPELYYLEITLREVDEMDGILRNLVGLRHVSITIKEDLHGPFDEDETAEADIALVMEKRCSSPNWPLLPTTPPP